MNFRGDEGKYLGLPGNDDAYMYDLLGRAADAGALVCPHPENIELVWKLRERPRDETLGPLEAWYRSRPPIVEAEAVAAGGLLRQGDRCLGLRGAHVEPDGTGCDAAAALGLREPLRRDLHPYLTLDTSADCGTYGKVNPPLRHAEDVEALWEGVASGAVDTIGSDHNARHRSNKEKDIWTASPGFPGTGPCSRSGWPRALGRGIALERMVQATSTRAAQLFGLYHAQGHHPGRLRRRPRRSWTSTAAPRSLPRLSTPAAEYTPWEGTKVDLRVVAHHRRRPLRDCATASSPTCPTAATSPQAVPRPSAITHHDSDHESERQA